MYNFLVHTKLSPILTHWRSAGYNRCTERRLMWLSGHGNVPRLPLSDCWAARSRTRWYSVDLSVLDQSPVFLLLLAIWRWQSFPCEARWWTRYSLSQENSRGELQTPAGPRSQPVGLSWLLKLSSLWTQKANCCNSPFPPPTSHAISPCCQSVRAHWCWSPKIRWRGKELGGVLK